MREPHKYIYFLKSTFNDQVVSGGGGPVQAYFESQQPHGSHVRVLPTADVSSRLT